MQNFELFRLVHEDNRRRIFEFNVPNSPRSLQLIQVKEMTARLGDHYHDDKDETFILLSGGGHFMRCIVNQIGMAESGVSTQEVEIGIPISVPRYHVHTFLLNPGSWLFCDSSEKYNPNGVHEFRLPEFP